MNGETEHDNEIFELDRQIEILSERNRRLESVRIKKLSMRFVAASGIHRGQVFSTDDAPDWMGHVARFGEWIKGRSPQRPFAEWNGCVYYTADLIRCDLSNDLCRMDDVPGGER